MSGSLCHVEHPAFYVHYSSQVSDAVVTASFQICLLCWVCEARTGFALALMGSGTVEVSRALLLSWCWSFFFFFFFFPE